jgi:cyclase
MERNRLTLSGLLLAACLAWPLQVSAQPQITSTEVRDGVFVIHTVIPTPSLLFQMNDLLLVGPDNVVLVDTLSPPPTLYFPLSAVIHTATSGRRVDMLINTSWHFDHVGLNDRFRLLEGTGTIIGHWRTASYLAEQQCNVDIGTCTGPFPPESNPTVVVEGQKRVALQSETIALKTVENAHSGADLFVFLEQANVMYTGDVYFGGMYPIIDRAGGGTINGTLAALRKILARIDDETIVVPSHGPVGNRQSIVEFVNMLQTARAQVRALIARGYTEEQVMMDPSFAGMDAIWGNGFIPGPIFRRIVYRDLESHRPEMP